MKHLILLSVILVLFACSGDSEKKEDPVVKEEVFKEKMFFTKLSKEESGIDFKNYIVETDSFNFYTFEYIYNGGGVAVGDINNDGLSDLYFTGNQQPDRVYLNKGDLKFEDITETAIGDQATNGWHTGVTMADVNMDGWVDIYISRSGKPADKNLLGNLLLINNKDNTFTEKGEEYGVNVKRMTTQSAFFDFDNDGDLDLYVMNHPTQDITGAPRKTVGEINELIESGSPDADVLLENVDGKFVDISKKAGIGNHSYGLGIAISDINRDGYDDIFITNDYMAPDQMYINNGDGTFTNKINEQLKHISNFAMGNDIGDFNNDGLPDIMTVDMASEDHVRSKKNMGGMSTKKFWGVVAVGFHYQYMFNTLQLNNGNGSFSEISQSAGVSKTDWSWAPLFVDFDNDGHKDLFISNGYRKDSRDNDYLQKLKNPALKDASFDQKLELMPSTKIQNYIYKNNGDYHFDKKMKDWKMDFPVNSNGAAFADLDNDGDLDLVLNNIDEESVVLRNDLNSKNNYIRIHPIGSRNFAELGAKVQITTKDGIQYQELQVTRGYISSVENILHFGIAENTVVDEIKIDWVDGKTTILKDVEANQVLKVNYNSSDLIATVPQKDDSPKLFTDATDKMTEVRHDEHFVDDFVKEVLLPNKMSQLGPFVSTGDVNGDGLEDFYLSGSRLRVGQLYIQQEDGQFALKKGPWQKEDEREEMDSEMFDVDNDGDLDLYVVSGGNEHDLNTQGHQDQLYINDGEGNFKNETKWRLPPATVTSGQRIATADIDNDGDLDLFIGGRQTPGLYPYPPRSFLFRNEEGVFRDISNESKDLLGPGLITDMLFDDFDGDGDEDLICVGEWMPVSFFRNTNSVFTNVTEQMGTSNDIGWWYSISKGDFNGDGKNDYVVGNLGTNNKFHPTKEHPLEIYLNDFDKTGTYDIVLAKYQNNVCYPVRGRECSSQQMPFITSKFRTYGEFAEADITKLYGEEMLESALHYSATTFKSTVLLSNEKGSYSSQALPALAQFSPINASHVIDVNKDGHLDIVGIGNNYGAEVETVRYDGGSGVVLLGDGKGKFTPKRGLESGFHSNEDDKDMALIKVGDKPYFIIASNNSNLKWIGLNN